MTSWQATMLQQSNIASELMTTTAMTICNVNVREKRMRAFNQYINYLIRIGQPNKEHILVLFPFCASMGLI